MWFVRYIVVWLRNSIEVWTAGWMHNMKTIYIKQKKHVFTNLLIASVLISGFNNDNSINSFNIYMGIDTLRMSIGKMLPYSEG